MRLESKKTRQFELSGEFGGGEEVRTAQSVESVLPQAAFLRDLGVDHVSRDMGWYGRMESRIKERY